MNMTRRAKRFVGIPWEVLVTPRDGEVYTNRWWLVENGKCLFWQGATSRGFSPQCNANRAFFDRDTVANTGLEVLYLPVAYLGHWDEEYGITLSRLKDEMKVLWEGWDIEDFYRSRLLVE